MKRSASVAALALGLSGCADLFAPPPVRAYIDVAAGGEHTCAVTEDGEAYCWGRGVDGELGTGRIDDEFIPAKVQSDVVFKSITAGDAHTCALDTEGRAHCWGWNAYFQLGSTAQADLSVPQPVETTERFASISAGAHHTCALTIDQRVLCWGYNRFGQVGDGTTSTVTTPTAISVDIRAFNVTAGGHHTCAPTISRIVYCWGRNEYGQLGQDASSVMVIDPAPVQTSLRFSQIDAGLTHTCGVATDAQIYCWGSAVHGEIGDGAPFRKDLPGPTTPTAAILMPPMSFVSAGVHHTCAVAQSLETLCWGRGIYGQLANADIIDHSVRQPVYLQPRTNHRSDRLVFDMIAASGSTHTCGLAERAVFCWGKGVRGQLGGGSQIDARLPMRVND
jgi:alpha-tubulin suppressor-like RCC1 family protein